MKKSILIIIAIIIVAVITATTLYFIFLNDQKLKVKRENSTVTIEEGTEQLIAKNVDDERKEKVSSVSKLSRSLDSPIEVTLKDGTGGALKNPITVSFAFKEGSEALKLIKDNSDQAFIGVFSDKDNAWIKLPTLYDSATNTLSAKTKHLSTFDALIAKEIAEPLIQEIIDKINENKPTDQALVGGYIIVDGVITATSGEAGNEEYTFETDFRQPWGCFEDPGDGPPVKDGEPIGPLDFDPVQVAGGKTEQSSTVEGDSSSIFVDVLGVWFFDAGEDNTFSGVVMDQDSKPVKDGEITLKNIRSGKTKTAKTDPAGVYNIKFQSGPYTMSFKKSSCKSKENKDLMCGWGRVPWERDKQQHEFPWDVTTECEETGKGGFHGMVNYTYSGGIDASVQVDLDLEKQDSEEIDVSKPFWAGEWTGTLTQDIDLQEEQLKKLTPFLKEINTVENKTSQNIKLNLIAGENGEFSDQSKAFSTQTSDISGSSQFTVCVPYIGCQSGGEPWSVDQAGTKGSTPVVLIEKTDSQLKIKLKDAFPFDQPKAGLATIHNPAVITIEKTN